MEYVPWFAWIPDALRANAEVNRQLLEGMGGLENRLAAIEKTLTDIP